MLLKRILLLFVRFSLSLRYRIRVNGLAQILEKGNSTILFMPNHPALIDPVIVMSLLYKDFKPRPLADEEQAEKKYIRPLMNSIDAVVIPDLKRRGNQGRKGVLEGVQNIIGSLNDGNNILLYPAGRIYRSRYESIGANSSVELVLRRVPQCRTVLIRTTGLWGSSFSRANGLPSFNANLKMFFFALLSAGFFFMPRREVVIDFVEPNDFPREQGKLAINRYLEEFYNNESAPNSFVPYFWWQGREAKRVAEPAVRRQLENTDHIPTNTKELVLEKLRQLSGVTVINQKDSLAQDLGLDSLIMVEFATWLEQEFGVSLNSLDGVNTVAHCMLAAAGYFNTADALLIKDVDERWLAKTEEKVLSLPSGSSVAKLFLQQARKKPQTLIVTDEISGPKTYRDLLTGIFALRDTFMAIPEKHVGIMLPATVSAVLSYFTLLFSEKVPVMVNWTVGHANIRYCLQNARVKHVLTAKVLYEKIKGQGIALDDTGVTYIFLEDIAASLTFVTKLKALFQARFNHRLLENAKIQETAAILFTSGSESSPKSVPLSHGNFMANLKDFTAVLPIQEKDRLLAMLPPFHSLGLAGTIILPLTIGLPTVYSPNPTEAALLAKLVDAHQVTLLIGTPTFLGGIATATADQPLDSVRIAFTGAEKCQPYVYEAMEKAFPEVVVCEGYGITECSPLVSINDPLHPLPGTIGVVMPSMDYCLVHPESGEKVGDGERGVLLLRGPNVFSSYLNYSGKSPFREYQGKIWYDSGDIVIERDKVLTFAGRLKRFIKQGGEMISLPAIEELLITALPATEEPVLAVTATAGDDHPEIVLFCCTDLSREQANRIIRDRGFSALHNIRRVLNIEQIPVLGTGKTDYQSLDLLLK